MSAAMATALFTNVDFKFFPQYEAVLAAIHIDALHPEELLEAVVYKGFDRKKFLTNCMKLKISPRACIFCSLVGAVRGNNYTKFRDDIEWERHTGDAQILRHFALNRRSIDRKDKMIKPTFSRFASALPEFAAAILKEAKCPPRFPDLTCPAELQFPGAASLPLNKTTRDQHREFSKRFSALLPGEQKNQDVVYSSIASNAIPYEELDRPARELLKDFLEVKTDETRTDNWIQTMLNKGVLLGEEGIEAPVQGDQEQGKRGRDEDDQPGPSQRPQ